MSRPPRCRAGPLLACLEYAVEGRLRRTPEVGEAGRSEDAAERLVGRDGAQALAAPATALKPKRGENGAHPAWSTAPGRLAAGAPAHPRVAGPLDVPLALFARLVAGAAAP